MFLTLAGVAHAASPLEQALTDRVTALESRGGLYVRGLAIASGDLLPRFYRNRQFQPVWTSDARLDELFGLLATAPEHGLDPADYYLEALQRLRVEYRQDRDPAKGADLDILSTESLIRFGYHQRFGKVNPERLEPNWNFTRQFRPGQDPLTTLNAAVVAPSLSGFMGEWIQRVPLYQQIQAQLREYRALAAAGGWPTIPAGPTLKPGGRDARLPLIRQRLAITGDLEGVAVPADPAIDPEAYDDATMSGIRVFQERHGLEADGVLGAGTLAALNVPVTDRIDQLRLTLERARWIIDDTVDEFIVVNIAGYEVFVSQAGQVVWRRRAIMGKVMRQTPIFKGTMTYIDVNPTWTVPPTILRQDVLPKVRQDRSYLTRRNIRVLDRNGREVNPASVDWSSSGRSFPYVLRQDPGPDNSLGRIKFMFPNPHAVFLHDTPDRNLFDRADRSFSSGCIRVEDPFSLAELLLRDPAQWNRKTLDAIVDTGKTRTIRLTKPWPVLILYWTAELDAAGRVRFLKDVYRRDAAVLAALNGAVRIEFPEPRPAAVANRRS